MDNHSFLYSIESIKLFSYNTVSIVKSQMYLYSGHIEKIVLLIYE